MNLQKIFYLLKLLRSQRFSKTRLENIQLNKLKNLMRYSHDNVPYYNRLFDSGGIEAEDIRSIRDLQAVPITRRNDIQSLSASRLVSKIMDIRNMYKLNTGGTSGTPLSVYFSKYEFDIMRMYIVRTLFANGLRFRHRSAYIVLPADFSKDEWYMYLGILKRDFFSNHTAARELWEKIKSSAPDVIYGFTNAIKLIAKEANEEAAGIKYEKQIYTMGYSLDQETRNYISSVFGDKIYDIYGNTECGQIAWECTEHMGYHIDMENIIVEFIRDGKPVGPGELGEIVITSLSRYSMPFIRYATGDLGTYTDNQCTCGRNLRLIKSIEGLVADCLTLPGGKIYSPCVIWEIMRNIIGIKEFQIIQNKINEFDVNIVKTDDFSENTVIDIKTRFNTFFGNSIDIYVKEKEKIDPGPRGKVRTVISKVPVKF